MGRDAEVVVVFTGAVVDSVVVTMAAAVMMRLELALNLKRKPYSPYD